MDALLLAGTMSRFLTWSEIQRAERMPGLRVAHSERVDLEIMCWAAFPAPPSSHWDQQPRGGPAL